MIFWTLAWAVTPWEHVEEVRVQDPIAVVPPTASERAALTTLVESLVRAAPRGTFGDKLPAQAHALGLELVVEDDVAVLRDRRGWGLLALRLGPARPWVFEAPHPWFDLGTGRLVDQLFRETDARAAVFATVHRRLTDHTDAAHEPEGGFQTLTLAVAEALEEPVVVQIHGFGAGRTGADVVVGGWGARTLAEVLASDLQWIATDGRAVPSLAGQTNVQVRALAGRAPVAHLELARHIRKALREDPARRQQLWKALQRWAPE